MAIYLFINGFLKQKDGLSATNSLKNNISLKWCLWMQPVKVETKNPNRPYRKCFSGEEYASYPVLKNSSSFSASNSDACFDSCYVGFKELTSHVPCLPLSLILRSYHCSQLAVFISTLTPLLQHITKSKDLKIIVWRLSPKSN